MSVLPAADAMARISDSIRQAYDEAERQRLANFMATINRHVADTFRGAA